ncbi:MAG: ABC transporter permease [Actinomycetota bacterium]
MSDTTLDPTAARPEVDVSETEGLDTKATSFFRQTLSKFVRHRLAVVGFFTLTTIVLGTFIVPALSPYDEFTINIPDADLGPSWSWHLFGTDDLGRDLFVRIMLGTRTSLYIALIVAVLSTLNGSLLGALAGYFGGWVDAVVAQLVNLLLVVPGIAILAVFGLRYGSRPMTMAIILAGLSWIRIARVVRAQFFQLREQEFVQAALAAGAGPRRIIFRHLAPNVAGPVMVEITLIASTAIILEATLAFLGLGVQPPEPALGLIINDFKGAIDSTPSRVLIPGGILTAIAMSLNFMGDGLRDALDPKNRKVRE